ncbi:MAG TPA: hypothetical protein VGI16_15640 [Candidatus Acidoferrum sp.]|jgi:hypothetical protein
MKTILAVGLCGVLAAGTAVPARADFKYTSTSKITGGMLKNMMKSVSFLSKQASQAMQPVSTTYYVKGNRMRMDNSDGTVEIIDLDGRRIIRIDTAKRTYSETTFEELKAMIQKQQEQIQQKAQSDPKTKDVKASMNAKVSMTPGEQGRQIQGQTTNEMKMQIEMELTAQQSDAAAAQASAQGQQPTGPVSGTITTSIDSWVAPSVAGYKEMGEFYVRMAKEVNWVPPSNIHIDPRVSQSMEEVQKNSGSLKGLPMLQYLSMTMASQQISDAAAAQAANNPPPATASPSGGGVPTSASDVVMKGLGGLFAKKKKKDDAAAAAAVDPSLPPAPVNPNALMEMTISVTSYSDAGLEGTLFEAPTGYAKVASGAEQVLGAPPAKK